jgi:hypothetical protein
MKKSMDIGATLFSCDPRDGTTDPRDDTQCVVKGEFKWSRRVFADADRRVIGTIPSPELPYGAAMGPMGACGPLCGFVRR